MKVKATKAGYFSGTRRKLGEEFEVPDGASAKWFEPVGDVVEKSTKVVPSTPARKTAKQVQVNEPRTFSEITKKDGEDQKPKGAEDLV